MKNLSETSYVIGIKIHRDRFEKTLSLSQKAYIKIVLGRIKMQSHSTIRVQIVKEKFQFKLISLNNLEKENMKGIKYAYSIVSLIYQVYTKLDIRFIVEVLGKY